MGYRPGATGADGKPSWFQPVPLVRHTATVPSEVVFRRGTQQLTLPTGPGVKAEVVLRSMGNTDRVVAKDAELVFVGYGIVAPEHGWDDYRGLDVKGKIVVLLNFNPPWAGKGVRLWSGRWDYKYIEAARHGALGALMVHTNESASYPWQVVASSNRSVAFALPSEEDSDPHLAFQGWVTHEAAVRLFALAGRDLSRDETAATDPAGKGGPSVPLGVTASLDMPVLRERIESANVVGILPGVGSQAGERGGPLHGPPRPPRHAYSAGPWRAQRLLRRGRQRLRVRDRADDCPRPRRLPPAAICRGGLRQRGRARPARVALVCGAPHGEGRTDRGRHQRRRDQRPWPYPGCRPSRAGEVEPGRDRQGARRRPGSDGARRSLPRPWQLLPIRRLRAGTGRRPDCPCPGRPALRGSARGLGEGAERALPAARLPPAERHVPCHPPRRGT